MPTRNPDTPGATISRAVSLLVRIVKTILHIDTEYAFTSFSIVLPPDHLLPVYSKYHSLYEKFLPHLVRYLEPHSSVVDVGANCGDTVAAMYDANRTLNYTAVEADEGFFSYLKTNIARIKAIDASASIATVRALVGRNVSGVSLEGSGGTKKAVIDGSGPAMMAEPLDRLVPASAIPGIRLVKTDVDGFDYDVLDSAESIIAAARPLIFMECYFEHAFQKTGYERTLEKLRARGYGTWVLFDNYGAVVLRTTDLQQVLQLFDYVWRQNCRCSTRTIYYFDVLTFVSADTQLITRVVADYLAASQ